MPMLESCVGPMSGSVTVFRKVDLGNVLVSFSELVMVRLVISNVILIMIALDPTGNGTVLNDMVHWKQNHAAVRVTSVNRSIINSVFHVIEGTALSGFFILRLQSILITNSSI